MEKVGHLHEEEGKTLNCTEEEARYKVGIGKTAQWYRVEQLFEVSFFKPTNKLSHA